MAGKRIKLEVIVTDNGTLKVVGKDLKGVRTEADKSAKSFDRVSNAANKTKRNLEGVSQRSGSTGKDFSRMSQGMGGLVQAYATVAANVFALSSAFLVLRRAADLSSMIKSAENFSSRYGVSVTRVTEQLQKATGGAISFAEALPTVNKAVSAGVPIEKMEQLAIAATKASQTFGGSATEALNRFISASQRGRVEIIQTLGVVIKTEQAYKDYGATIGKTAQELSAYDRQQAILNATIEASQSVFDKVNIDPNPFQQLVTTITDLKDSMLSFITDSVTPFLNFFNKSKDAALLLIAVLLKMVGGRIFPALGERMKELQQASLGSTSAALAAAKKAKRDLERFENTKAKVSVARDPEKQLKKADAAFRKSLGNRISMHKDFTNAIFTQEGKLNEKVLNQQRAAIKRTLTERAKGNQGFKIFAKLTTAELEKQLTVLTAIGSQIKGNTINQQKAAQATAQTTTAMRSLELRAKAANAQSKALFAQFTSLKITGKSRAFNDFQQSAITSIRGVGRAWGKLIKDLASGDLTGAFASLGRAWGRSLGFLSASFQSLFGWITTITIAWQAVQFLIDKFGDKFQGISKSFRAVEEAGNSFTEGLEKANEALLKGIELWGDRAPSSLKDFKDSFQFLAGSFESIAYEASNFSRAVIKELNNLTVDQAIERIRELKVEIQTLGDKTFEKEINNATSLTSFDDSLAPYALAAEKSKEVTEEQRAELEKLEGALKALSQQSLTPLINQYSRASEFAEKLGTNLRSVGRTDTNAYKTLEKDIGSLAPALAMAVSGFGTLESAIDPILKDVEDNPEQLTKTVEGIIKYLSAVSGELSNINRQAASSLGSLQEIGGRFNTFLLGIDKARSQKSPFKEIFGFTLDTENALRSLTESLENASNTTLEEAFKSGELKGDLSQINQLLGGQTTSIQDAYEQAVKLRKEYQAQLEVQLTGGAQLKLLQLELKNIKDRELRSDKDRLDQVYDSTVQQLTIARTQGDLKEAEITAQKRLIAALGPVTEENAANVRLEMLKLALMERELDALDEQERKLLKFTQYRLKDIELQKEALTSAKSQLTTLTQAATLNRKLVSSLDGYLTLSEDIYIAKKAQLKIDAEIIEANKAAIRVEFGNSDIAKRRIKEEDAKLLLLKQQTAELDRQQESRLAQELEVSGTTIFSKDAVKATAHFFRRALEEEIPKLKSTFEVLGRGLSKTLIDTFDLMVDNLLEGGKDFAETVREGLKASLREVFGSAIKNDLRRIFVGATQELKLFDKLFPQDAAEAQDRAELKTARQNTQIFQDSMLSHTRSIDQSLQTIAGKGVGGAGVVSAPAPTLVNNPAALNLIQKESKLPGLDNLEKELKGIGATLEKPQGIAPESVEELNKSPNVVTSLGVLGTLTAASQGDTKTAIVTALFTIASQIIASQQAAAVASTSGGSGGGIFESIGNFIGNFLLKRANGGMLPGGFKPMATGGIVTMPTLGLVGEGSRNEAVVPLPNNREIPVEMRGSTGDTINIEQNFDFRNADAGSIAALRTEAKMIEERTFNRVFSEINKGGKYAKMVGRRR